MKKIFTLFILSLSFSFAQDAITFPYPVPPFNSTQLVTGTFGEYRNTLSSNHFHNGTDLPNPDGTPVYSSLSGVVHSFGTQADYGTSAFVRIRTHIGGMWKHISYVHIVPNPALGVGSPVTAGNTILGTTITGQAHVHVTERELVNSETSTGVEINSLREPGGYTPYVDTYSPKVLSIRFFQDNSNVEFTNRKIYGPVDFVVHMVERNGPGEPNTSSTTNNGVYLCGYKILSADRTAVLYVPPLNGIRYRFNYKPNDAHVNVAFTLESTLSMPIYYLTNGSGNIGATNQLRDVYNNYFNTTLLPAGNYQLMVFAQDTHGNADTVYAPFEITTQDVLPPAPPILKSVLNDSINKITISWYPNSEADLKGYNLYFSNNEGGMWQKHAIVLNRNTTTASFISSGKLPLYFRLTAYDSAAITNESTPSDWYGIRPNIAGKKILVIDAFDRTSGSYKFLSHNFAMITGQSISAGFETAHNRTIVDGNINVNNYDAVVWNFGDESTSDKTFGPAEQIIAKAYLQQGGKIFVNGSEIAYDLDRPSGPSVDDRDFLNNYLKAKYAGDASNSYTVNGVTASFLDGVSLAYGDTLQGSPYREDYPDYVYRFGGSDSVARYANGLTAITAFSGMFPSGTKAGAVVFSGFPFETIHTKANRDALMTKILNYFGVPTSIQKIETTAIPQEFSLEQNYPNPFNPVTTITFSITPSPLPKGEGLGERVTLKIYDVLGKEIATLVNEELPAGTYSVQWNASHVPSGTYFYTLRAGNFTATKKLSLIK